jgi:excisionase family DNA binding protein
MHSSVRRDSPAVGLQSGQAKNATSEVVLLTVDEVATFLRTTRKAIYVMSERGALPGAVRIGRRLLFGREALLHWLRQKSAPSLER